MPNNVIITKNQKTTPDTHLLDLDYSFGNFNPGQFLMLSCLGYGEAPFGIMQPACNNNKLQILVRNVGNLTDKITSLKKGSTVDIRGPYGNGFPVQLWKKKNIIMVAGGTGIVPIKALLDYFSENFNKYREIQLLYGARFPEGIFFQNELASCEKFAEILLTVEKCPQKWQGNTGLVTNLISSKTVFADNSVAVLCGPPIMYKFVIEKLKKIGFKNEDVFISLERRMRCGTGKCQHCTCGDKYVCLDGPIFRYDEVLKMPDGL